MTQKLSQLETIIPIFLLISMSFGVVSESLRGTLGFVSKPRMTNKQGQATGIRATCAEAGDVLCFSWVVVL
jgi:hypothetical protein